MDDIKLVELSINAAGWQLKGWLKDSNGIDVAEIYADGKTTYFQPLHENTLCDCMGNALRLAVRLNLDISFDSNSDGALVYSIGNYDDGGLEHCIEYLNNDALSATRRAIVRAAAQIGKEMK